MIANATPTTVIAADAAQSCGGWGTAARCANGESSSTHAGACVLEAREVAGLTPTREMGRAGKQHEELDVLGGGRAAHQQDQPEYLPEDQIQQPR